MTTIYCYCTCASILLYACSTPDDPTYTVLVRDVAALPPTVADAVKNSARAYDIWRWLVDTHFRFDEPRPPSSAPQFKHTIFETTCDGDDDQGPMTFGSSVLDMLKCMGREGGEVVRSFSDCIRAATGKGHELYQQHTGAADGDIDCHTKLSKEFLDAPVSDWTDSMTDEGLVDRMIASPDPPPWLVALGVAIVGGVVVVVAPEAAPILFRLCILQGTGHWSCPSSPLYPPGATPQPPMGDRQ